MLARVWLPMTALPRTPRDVEHPKEEAPPEVTVDIEEPCNELIELLVRAIEGDSILRTKLDPPEPGDPFTGNEVPIVG